MSKGFGDGNPESIDAAVVEEAGDMELADADAGAAGANASEKLVPEKDNGVEESTALEMSTAAVGFVVQGKTLRKFAYVVLFGIECFGKRVEGCKDMEQESCSSTTAQVE